MTRTIADPFMRHRNKFGFGRLFFLLEKAVVLPFLAPIIFIAFLFFRTSYIHLRKRHVMVTKKWQYIKVPENFEISNFKLVNTVQNAIYKDAQLDKKENFIF